MALYPIELNQELKIKAKAKAKSEGKSLAAVIRQLLANYVEPQIPTSV